METVSAGIRAEIRAADDRFESLFEQQDAADIAELYTDGGMLLPPGSKTVTGRNAIREFWQGAMDMGIKKARLEIVEIERHDRTVVELGRYELSGAGGESLDNGKYIVIWRSEGGAWKLHRDMWNSSVAAKE